MADTKLDNIASRLDTVVEKLSDVETKLEIHVAKFEAHIEREDKYQDALQKNTEVLRENTESLKDHMARTDLLEQYVKKMDERFTPLELNHIQHTAVTEWWKGKVMFLAKIGGAIGALGAIAGIVKWLLKSI